MRIDLHAHSSVSDGTEPPEVVVAGARAARLDVLALTDHDSTAGWPAAEAAAAAAGITFVPGAELSCRHAGVSLHLLAYWFDPAEPALAAELARLRADRLGRTRAIVDRLAADGWPVTWPAVLARAGGAASVGRPHVADALVDAGAVADRDEAFARLLHSGSPYYVAQRALDPLRAVELVRDAGGVTVFAHPRAARRGRVVGDDVVAALAAAGLAGLEADHPDHTPADVAHLRGLAGDLGLLVTGSSDYHGAGQRAALGARRTEPEAFAALRAAAAAAARR